jgi:hypothetical protein
MVKNLFAFRATNPKDMLAPDDPIGPRNNAALEENVDEYGFLVACWGGGFSLRGRDQEVIDLLPPMQCFGPTKSGYPKHPSRLPYATKLVPLARSN